MQYKRYLLVASIILAIFLLGACSPVNKVDSNQAEVGGTLCFADYQQCIDPIFHSSISARTGAATCSSSGCHNVGVGAGGGFKLTPNADLDSSEMMANFFSARAAANLTDPDQSKIILEPLTGSFALTGSHAGGDIFAGASDACVSALKSWISKQVDDEGSAGCGVCSAPNIDACGF